MDKICEYSSCTGCGLCNNSCPRNAIKLVIDNYGFFTYKIRQDLCIDCGLCQNICLSHQEYIGNEPIEFFKAFSKNKIKRLSSSSGGIFFELASAILNSGGYVVAAGWNDNVVQHKIINKFDGLDELQKSKYLGSDTTNIYKEVKKLLKEGNRVLFSGTPCQNHALKIFLKGNTKNLLQVDFICHGVGSYNIFNSLINQYNFSNNIKSFSFRNKRKDFRLYEYALTFDNNKTIQVPGKITTMGHLFESRLSTRPSCDDCKYANILRCSDITLGDFTPVHKIANLTREERKYGVSLVLINTEKGKNFFKSQKGIKKFKIRNKKFILNRVNREKYNISSLKRDVLKDSGVLSYKQMTDKYFSLTEKEKSEIVKNSYPSFLKRVINKISKLI